ncbi:DUF4855 domain-containing protein [Paenibacillus sp. GXUN7292]|uniref:DUF4855 domain-containing protein n=1 Tax=Paenibacillus sp. GXUN7292 TaxID=3422499 RepID=UPI003D7D507B
MKTKKSWISLIVVAAMLLSFVPAAYAAEGDEEQSGVKNLAPESTYTWSKEPLAQYPDEDKALTDGLRGTETLIKGNWVGHQYGDYREVIFDLGASKAVEKVTANFLQDWPEASRGGSNVLIPLTVSFMASNDQEQWQVLSHNALTTLWKDGKYIEEFKWDGAPEPQLSDDDMPEFLNVPRQAYTEGKINARYIKVIFSLHSRAMSMIDEIEIFGYDTEQEDAGELSSFIGNEFLQPGKSTTGGIQHMGLLYNGYYEDTNWDLTPNKGDWNKKRLIPNIAYVDKQGEPQDWLFDGVLILGLASYANGDVRGFAAASEKANKADWQWYLDKTLKKNGEVNSDLHELNAATAEVAGKLNDPDHKTKVVLMIPEPGAYQSNFGEVNGENLDFSISKVGHKKSIENRAKAIEWYIDEALSMFEEAQFSHLEFSGFYWLEEQIDTDSTGPKMVSVVSDYIHKQAGDLKFFWIPHSLAYKKFMWQDVGIDAVNLQPNYFFEQLDPSRLQAAADMAKRYGMSLEIEFDDRMINDAVFRKRYIEYLNMGVTTGLMNEGFNAYYQGNNAVYDAAISTDPSTRILYDWLYKYTKGQYEVQDAAPPEVEVLLNGEPFQSGTKVSDQTKLKFTWKLAEEVEEGSVKVTAKFNDKPYTEGSEIDLTDKPGKHALEITAAGTEAKITYFVVEVEYGANRLIDKVTQYVNENKLKDIKASSIMKNTLEMMKRNEASNATEALNYLKQFNSQLDKVYQENHLDKEAYKFLKNAVLSQLDNIAENKPAKASSVEAAHLGADKAFDGVSATRWASETSDNQWLQVDFGETKTFDTILANWEFARASEYQLLISNNGVDWTPIIVDGTDKFNADQYVNIYTFEPVQGQYLKMNGIHRATGYGFSLYELAAYDTSFTPSSKVLDGIETAIDAKTKKVTITGLAMSNEAEHVDIAVKDPKGDIQFTGSTIINDEGRFVLEFTLVGEVEGVYTVEIETEGMTEAETVTFEYKKYVTPPGGGGGPIITVPDKFNEQSNGSMKAELDTTIGANGTAAAAITAADLNTALSKAKADAKGKKHIIVVLKKNGNAASYAITIPAAAAANEPNVMYHVETPAGNIDLPGNALRNTSDQQLTIILSDIKGSVNAEQAAAIVGSRPAVAAQLLVNGEAVEWNKAAKLAIVTLPYVLGSNERAEKVRVYEVTADGKLKMIGGVKYDAAAKTVSFPISHNGNYAVGFAQPANFTDLGAHEWARTAIEELAERGIVKGTNTAQGTFAPGNRVTRADFLVMLVNTLGLKAEAASSFADVSENDYFYEAVSVARALGIVSGVDANHFAPKANISRQDMMVMMDRALQKAGYIKGKSVSDEIDAYKDADKVAGYAANSVAAMIEHGFINGSNGYLKPQGETSRAEAAAVLYRVLQFAHL